MEIKITYETLFDILRKEKSRDELQELQASFFDDIIGYINEKKNIVENQTKLDIFAEQEQEKATLQLKNIKKIIKELYDRREKKIINMAINKARTGSNIVNTAALLEKEKGFFESLVKVLESTRSNILLKVLNAQNGEKPAEKAIEEPKDIKTEEESKNLKKVRILDIVPKFVGLDLEIYGPYQEDDVINLPDQVADVLINTKKAEDTK